MICNIHKFREKLASGALCLGPGITFYDPSVTEAIAPSADFVWIDLEHNPTSLESLLSHLIAARAGGVASIVRVPSLEIAWTKRVLDTGAEGVILPRSTTVDEIRQFVDACRYPDAGTRGFGPRRPTNYARFGGNEYLQHANEQVFVVAQIETVETLEQLDEIVTIPGLDSLVVGPNDLSGSMGMLGQIDHPRVLEAIKQIAEKAHAAGLYVGLGMGAAIDYALDVRKLGVDWVQCGNDFEYMIRFADQLYGDIRQQLETP
ncbi:MAG: aldolase/citrate lyase family protein [Planctomycetota bacterium]|nr:aldolase/citrate lyase family protein [Planctomycetota bacterium]